MDRDILKRLGEPFPAEDVDWRLGTEAKDGTSALALAYIDARAVAERLDLVMGPFWQCEYDELRAQVQRAPEPEDRGDDGREGRGKRRRAKRSPSIVICRIGLSFDEGKTWIWRSDGSGDTDFEAEKGALSGAFKRAAVKWGIGAYLYGFESPWVEIETHGWTKKIARGEWPKLRKIAAAALDRYRAAQKGGQAFRAPPPDEEPARPGFEPAAPPARPEAPRAPARSDGGQAETHLAALRAAEGFADMGEVVREARGGLSGAVLDQFEKAYADKLVARIERLSAERASLDAIEAVAEFARKFKPQRSEQPRFVAALDKARREARGS